jgi:methylmalonyl-CoA mutase, C-terminal domain
MNGKIRIVMARLGMDAHWRGSIVVARALRDAGMEVIYLGNQMPEAIVKTAVDEDADVVGLSSLSGNHIILAPMVMKLLRENGMDRTVVVLGGTVTSQDWPALRDAGIGAVFGPGSSLQEIIDFISLSVQPSADRLEA